MGKIKYIMASLVLTGMGGALIFSDAQELRQVRNSLYAGYEVQGTVVDDVGPVAGAAVVEVGTSNGTSTDIDGRFSLIVSGQEAEVEISCIGYASQTFEAGSLPRLVTLKEDSQFLDEVVVIGYGTVKKDDLTGAITAIKAEDLNRGAVVSPQDMLKGKIAGLLVTPGDGGPGSGPQLRGTEKDGRVSALRYGSSAEAD